MNKTAAKKAAFYNTKTWGELEEMILDDFCLYGRSTINKQLTKEHAQKIFIDAINSKERSDQPKTTRYDISRNREVLSGDGLLVMNILREFG